LKQHNEHYRRKPSGHSGKISSPFIYLSSSLYIDANVSDVETHITGSFDPLPQTPSSRRYHHSLQPQETNSHRTRLTPFQRSISTESLEIDHYQTKLHRPQTAPQTSSKTANQNRMARKYQSGVIHQQTMFSKHPETTYKSSFYIDQAHTHRRSQEKLDQNQRQHYDQLPKQRYIQQANNLYLDSRSGII
jgi:hypothetical protein